MLETTERQSYFIVNNVLPNLKPPEPKAMIDPIPTSADGKPRLGRFGELLDAEGNQVLGKVLTKNGY